MYKSKFVMLLVGLLVTSVAFFGFGDTSQVGDDFFDSDWEFWIGDHVGYLRNMEIGRDFGSHQWSAKLEGFSEQADDNQEDFSGIYGLNGVWGSLGETIDPYPPGGAMERYIYLDMGSDARSSLSQTIWMGPKVHQNYQERTQVNGENGTTGIDPSEPGFDDNYKLYIYTNVMGDKGVYSRYDAGVLFEDSTEDEDATSRWYGGIASPRGYYQDVSSPNLKLLGEGPNSEVNFSLIVFKDSGTHGFVPVADHSVLGTSNLGAMIFSGTVGQQDDREVLVGSYLGSDGKAVVGKIETDEPLFYGNHRLFSASGKGKLTVTGSGRSDLHTWIYDPQGTLPNGGTGLGIPSGSLHPTMALTGVDYQYFEAAVTAGFSVGDTGNVLWSFEGGGQE